MQNKRKRNRTHYIHRLSYSGQERLAGSFVLIAIAILIWLLVSSQKTQNFFEEEYILYGTTDSIQAINKDTTIIVSGLNVGHVINVDITDDNKVITTMSIFKKYQKLIRADSTASLISFKFALVGKSVIEITVGSPSLPLLKDKNFIQIVPTLDLVKMLEKVEPVLVSLQDSIVKTNAILSVIDPKKISSSISAVERALVKTDEILSQIETNKIISSVNTLEDIAQDTSHIIKEVRNGEGVVGSMLYDERLNQDIKTSTKNLTHITEQMKVLLSTIQEQVYDIPELTGKIKPLLDEADKTIKATQNIWPLSGAIPEDKKQNLTAPESME